MEGECYYYGYPPKAGTFWPTIPLDAPIQYPEILKPELEGDEVTICEEPPSNIFWVSTTPEEAIEHENQAVRAGHEGWDGSPLWVIRASIDGNLLPGKLAIKHQSAFVAYNGTEVLVHDIDVLCVETGSTCWLSGYSGRLPSGSIVAGHTLSGESVFVGRVRYKKSITPGYVIPSRGRIVFSYGGSEKTSKSYEVLCEKHF